MRISDCKVNCEFFRMKKKGRARSYRCMSEKAPTKMNAGHPHVPGYDIVMLEECPEGFV